MPTHWKKLTNPNYLGSYAFEDGKEMILTVKSVGNEIVTGEGGRKEECTVCHFAENVKPMILNKTNMKTMHKIFGTPYIEEWSGHKIQIYVDPKVKFGRETTGGLRIRDRVIDNVPTIKCESCGNDIQPRGNMGADQIAAYTKQRFGQVLCADCSKRIVREGKNQEAENADE